MRSNLNFNNLSTSNTYDNKELEVTIKDFGGADYSHSTLFVDTSRATESIRRERDLEKYIKHL